MFAALHGLNQYHVGMMWDVWPASVGLLFGWVAVLYPHIYDQNCQERKGSRETQFSCSGARISTLSIQRLLSLAEGLPRGQVFWASWHVVGWLSLGSPKSILPSLVGAFGAGA